MRIFEIVWMCMIDNELRIQNKIPSLSSLDYLRWWVRCRGGCRHCDENLNLPGSACLFAWKLILWTYNGLCRVRQYWLEQYFLSNIAWTFWLWVMRNDLTASYRNGRVTLVLPKFVCLYCLSIFYSNVLNRVLISQQDIWIWPGFWSYFIAILFTLFWWTGLFFTPLCE